MFGKNIKLDEDILRKNRIPLLIEEAEWLKLFGHSENKIIGELKEELLKLVAQNNELESIDKNLNKEKIKYMKMILRASESLNDEKNKNKEKDIKLLDGYKERILEINNEIDNVRFQMEILPKEIREANFKLLTATVECGYNELKNKEKILSNSLEEIDKLRVRLKELLEIKHDNEEWINETYIFLHGILGSEVIEKIDRSKLR